MSLDLFVSKFLAGGHGWQRWCILTASSRQAYLVSERLGQAQAVSDYELYLFVSDLRDELSSERWQELTQLFQEPPWIGELVRLRLEFADAEAFAQTHPVAVSDEAWERMLQKHRRRA